MPAGSGSGLIVTGSRGDRGGKAPGRGGVSVPGTTDESGEIGGDQVSATPHPAVIERARRIARRLAIAAPTGDRGRPAASGVLATRRWRGGGDEIDLDATLDVLAANPLPSDEDILVRQRVRRRRSIVLVVDASYSASGEQVRTSAATVGALAGELRRDRLAVVAFWSDAALLSPLGAPDPPETLVDRLLAVPAQGLTNVSFALEVAAEQLRGVPAAEGRVVLLSDCVHNAGPDPRTAVPRLPRLDVLMDITGEHDEDLARDLALIGRGRCLPIRSHRDVAPALVRMFGR